MKSKSLWYNYQTVGALGKRRRQYSDLIFFRGKSKTFWIDPIQYVHLAVIDISPISTKMRLVFFFFFLFLVFSYSINNLTEDYKWSKLIVISPWKTFRSNCPDKFVTGQKYGSIDVKLISYLLYI